MDNKAEMIPLFKPYIPRWHILGRKLQDVFDSGYIAQGKNVLEFEQRFSDFIKAQAVAVSSCTGALHLALVLAGVEQGDEVISTPLTAEPTNLAIKYAGGKVVWADVDSNGNIDPRSVKMKITDKTRAIVCVHYGGVPVQLNELQRVAGSIPIIEDCAHALGAKYNWRHVGTQSDFGCFSFQAIKHMTTVEGGALVCRDVRTAKRLRWFGIDREQRRDEVDVREVGYKYNPNEVFAAMGIIQLDFVKHVIDLHITNGQWFDDNLRGIKDLWLCSYDRNSQPSYWFYTVFTERRNYLKSYLQERGIQCGKVHRRNDKHTIFLDSKCDLPSLDRFEKTALHIPCGWWITQDDRDRIAQTISEAMNG